MSDDMEKTYPQQNDRAWIWRCVFMMHPWWSIYSYTHTWHECFVIIIWYDHHLIMVCLSFVDAHRHKQKQNNDWIVKRPTILPIKDCLLFNTLSHIIIICNNWLFFLSVFNNFSFLFHSLVELHCSHFFLSTLSFNLIETNICNAKENSM